MTMTATIPARAPHARQTAPAVALLAVGSIVCFALALAAFASLAPDVARLSPQGQVEARNDGADGSALGAAIRLLPMVALFHRFTATTAMESPQRARLRAFVQTHPGATAAHAARALGMHYTTARHHLDRLVRLGVMLARRAGAQRRAYLLNDGTIEGPSQTLVAVAATAKNRALLQAISDAPGLTQQQLAARLGLAKSTVSERVARLREAGALSRQDKGLRLTASAAAALHRGAPALA